MEDEILRLRTVAEHVVKNCYCQPSGQACDLCRPAHLALLELVRPCGSVHGEPLPEAEDLIPCVACKRLCDPDEMNCPDEGLMCERCYDARYPG
jgi:hypothetical protein